MPNLSRRNKLLIAAFVVIALIVLGALLFPATTPEVHLAANYGPYTEGDHTPEPFAKWGPIYVTNTLITSWISVIVLAVLFYLGTRRMKLVPKGLQNLLEFALEWLIGFVESAAGEKNGRRFFPIIATIFLFVLANAWTGLLPIYNVIGYGHEGTASTLFYGTYEGHLVETALLRPANTDINVPLMLALVSFVCVEYWGITALGFRHYAGKFFRFGQFVKGLGLMAKGQVKSALGTILNSYIDIFVGILELLSEFIRIVSFTFRLFGNMTAGEVLLISMAFVVPAVLPVLFYGLETLFGAIQALIFAGLTLVFATLAVAPHEAEHEH